MTVDEAISKLQELRGEVGGDALAFGDHDGWDAYEISSISMRTCGTRKGISTLPGNREYTMHAWCDGKCNGSWCQDHIQVVEIAKW